MMEPAMFVLIFFLSVTPGYSLENVALGKSATQSGTHALAYTRYGADKAVDGNTNPDSAKNSCSIPDTRVADAPTRDKNGPAWWRVDLGQEFDVYQVKIYNRKVYQDRLSKTWVLVTKDDEIEANDETICHDITDGIQDIITAACNYNNQLYKRGRYVTLWRQADGPDPPFMAICEVQVFSCPGGTWGMNLPGGLEDCSQLCPRTCLNNETCRIADGFCASGCTDGFWGKSCDQECHCAGAAPCDVITGSCGAAGCEADYISDNGTCVTESPISDPTSRSNEENKAGTGSPDNSITITGLTVAVTAVGAVVAVVLLIVVVAVVLLYRRISGFTNNGTKSVEDDMPLGQKLTKQQGIQPTPGINPGFDEDDIEYETLRE